MISPGIDKWVEDAPKSWAKLAKTKGKKTSFNQWKKKFYEGVEKQNKDYLKKYLTDEQLKKIYTDGYGGTIKKTGGSPINPPTKPKTITIKRNNKQYTKTNTPRWQPSTKYTLTLAAKTKTHSPEYDRYVSILMGQGRTRQATTKKIQRTRKAMK